MLKRHCDLCDGCDGDEDLGKIQRHKFYAGKGYNWVSDPLGQKLIDVFEDCDLCEYCFKEVSDMSNHIGSIRKHEFLMLHLIKNAN